MRSRRGVVLLAVAGIVVLLAIAGWFQYQAANYVTSDYAWINAPAVWVNAPATGTLQDSFPPVGSSVRRGQTLATLVLPGGRRVPVRSPLQGQIGAFTVAAGSTVMTGTPLVPVVAVGRATVVAEVPETAMSNVHRGQTVTVTLDAYPGQSLIGTVARIGRATLSTTTQILTIGTFSKQVQYVPVIIRMSGGWPGRVEAGESATVSIHI